MFFNTSFLSNEEIQLRLQKTVDGNDKKDWLPTYHFAIGDKHGRKMGVCDLRIGHNIKTYYGGISDILYMRRTEGIIMREKRA